MAHICKQTRPGPGGAVSSVQQQAGSKFCYCVIVDLDVEMLKLQRLSLIACSDKIKIVYFVNFVI